MSAFELHLARQRRWSERTFGPGDKTLSITSHIRKELVEVEQEPRKLEEWIDVLILTLDGACRTGATDDEIMRPLEAKQRVNEGRKWVDWRTVPHGTPYEHVRK